MEKKFTFKEPQTIENFLAHHPYLNGASPGKADAILFKKNPKLAEGQYPNIENWRRCIGLFSNAKRDEWMGKKP